jgi:hypothetical protein
VFSYGPDVDFGLVAARTLLPDLPELAERIRASAAELLTLALKTKLVEKQRVASEH